MTENKIGLNQIRIFDLRGKERNFREIRRNTSFPLSEDVSDLTIIEEEGDWVVVFAGLSKDHSEKDEVTIRTTLRQFIHDVEQKHAKEFEDSSLWDDRPLSKIQEMHFKGETSFFLDIRSAITQYFPNLVELSEILSQKEEIPLSAEEIEEIKAHRGLRQRYLQQRARRVHVNIERGLIAGTCYFCQCPSLEIKKDKEVIVSCPNCGKQFFIEIRPQKRAFDLDDDFIKRFLGYTDPSRIKILPPSYRKAPFPVDESTRRFFESDDPNYKPLLEEAYLREKRNEADEMREHGRDGL